MLSASVLLYRSSLEIKKTKTNGRFILCNANRTCPLDQFVGSILGAYCVLSSIQCSSCVVMFWFLHSVRLAMMTPGLKEHVFALIPSFLIDSFLKSKKPM